MIFLRLLKPSTKFKILIFLIIQKHQYYYIYYNIRSLRVFIQSHIFSISLSNIYAQSNETSQNNQYSQYIYNVYFSKASSHDERKSEESGKATNEKYFDRQSPIFLNAQHNLTILQFEFKMPNIQAKRIALPLVLVLFAMVVDLGMCQIAPQFAIINPVLASNTSYKMSYYSPNNLTTATVFTVNFNQSNLKVLDGANNCTIKVGGTAVLTPQCACLNRVCTFKPMMASTPMTVEIEMSNVTNPMFLHQQIVAVLVFFNSSSQFNYNVVIPSSNYQPMSMVVNRITQSDYGVGYTPVSYTFNISLYYISKNMQMQVTIPPEITFTSIASELSFYSTIQNSVPMQVQSLLIFNLQIDTIANPTGFMLLKLSGLGNPRFLGNSSSFKITFVETSAITNCANCKIAELSSNLTIESRVPGDVIAVSIDSSNKYISATNILNINLQLFAGIPQGGRVSIYLPAEIVPPVPSAIECNNIYGFLFTDANTPTCSYNSTFNRIDTVNFNTPYFDSTGNGIISLKVVNPIDSRNVNFTFQTYDQSGRMIGQSRSNYYFNAIPLPMSVAINKTASEVDKLFNMSCEIILTQSLNLSNNYIEIVLPSVTYNLSSIQCLSAGQNLACNKTYDATQQLYIKFAPPCTVCTSGSSLKFSIVGLQNPSFINEANQQITVNTRSINGIVESAQKSVVLTPSAITLNGYTKPTNMVIGFKYNLDINISLPNYVKTNGGQAHLLFSPYSTYYDGQVANLAYSGPSYSLQIVSLTNSSSMLQNSVQYFPDLSPDCISKIIVTICDNVTSFCGSDATVSLRIRRLKLGYIPALSSTDTLRITTKYGEVISEKVMDTSAYAPILYSGALIPIVSTSVTNSYSDMQFSFTSTQVVIDQQLIFSLPIGLTINGQCSLSSPQGFVTSFVCAKTSPNTITVTSTSDQGLMISQTITYVLSLSNVSTPTSTTPLTYALETTYNGTRNQRFTTRFAMQSALPLSLTASRSNSTIYQEYNFTLNIAPVASAVYDSFQILLSKSTIITQQSWMPSSVTVTENQTHYILTQSSVLFGNTLQFKAKNSLSTYDTPQHSIVLLQAGYSVQQNSIDVGLNTPVVLGCSVSLTNRTVSMSTSMTVTCDRNSNGQLQQQALTIKLPSNGFDYTGASAGGNTINVSNPVVTVAINSSSPRVLTVTIINLKNILFTPIPTSSSISAIQFSTVTAANKTLGRSSLPSTTFTPNDGYDIRNTTASRLNTKNGEVTNISIVYNTVLGGNTGYVLQLTMPTGQNVYSSNSGCYLGAAQTPCSIASLNSTDILITYTPNITILLTKVLNIFPNTNLLSLRLYLLSPTSQLQLVQQSNASISPPILLQPLSVGVQASSSRVAAVSTLTFALKPTQIKIFSTDTIKISVPNKMFTRAFNSEDCVIRNGDSSFTGCTFASDSSGWLSLVTVSTVGPFDIEINATLSISFTVTNSWTSYPFTTNAFTITVYKNQLTTTSQGVSNFTDIYSPLLSFTLVPVVQSTSTLTQQSLQAASMNNLSLSISLNGNVGKSSKLLFLIPKDSFVYPSPTAALLLEREDPSYYYVSITVNCATAGCQNYSQQTVLTVQNALYIKKQRNNFMAYIVYDGLPVTENFVVVPDYHTPSQVPQLTLARTSNVGSESTIVKVQFNLNNLNNMSQSPLGEVTVDLSSNITNSQYSSTAYSYSQLDSTLTQSTQIPTSTVTKSQQNITLIIPTSASSTASIHQLQINGKNTIQVPIGVQKYWVVVQNSTHILYKSMQAAFGTALTPLATGLALVRTSSTVASVTDLKLQGMLPSDQLITFSQYALTVNSTQYQSPSQPSISISLPQYTNPPSTENEPSVPISLCNTTHCIYKQTSAVISPALTAIQYTTQDVNFAMLPTMTIKSNYVAVVNFTQQFTNKNDVKVSIDDRLVAAFVAVNGYTKSTVDNSLVLNTDLTFGVDAVAGNPSYKQITIKSRSNRLINVTSLEITFRTSEYQLYLANSSVKLMMELPSTVFSTAYNFTLKSTAIAATVTSTSNRTKANADYLLTVQPILRAGVLTVEIPSYISNMYNGNTPSIYSDDTFHAILHVEINSQAVSLTSTNTQQLLPSSVPTLYSLTYNSTNSCFTLNFLQSLTGIRTLTVKLSNVVNPSDNQPLLFNIYQHEVEDVPRLVYGYAQIAYKMTILDSIRVYNAVRNVSKIGVSVEINFDIQTNTTSQPDTMLITLSTTQVSVIAGVPCRVCINGLNCDTNQIVSQPIGSTNSFNLYPHMAGRHNYTVSGCLRNSLFSEQPSAGDEISVSLSTPYWTAQSLPSTSCYITPLITTGEIQLLSFIYSSPNRIDYTTLSLALQPENYLNCDALFFKFDALTYYLHNSIAIEVNSVNVPYHVVNSSAVFVLIGDNRRQIMNVKLKNVINYIDSKGFTVSSMKKKVGNVPATTTNSTLLAASTTTYNPSEYGIADQLVLQASNQGLTPQSPSTRIIFPNNYVSSSAKTFVVINDYNIPAELPTSTLRTLMTSTLTGCSQDVAYNKTLSFQCIISTSGQASITVSMYDTKLPNLMLATFTKSINVYPAPNPHCSSALCDVCSTASDGSQYCFVCREGLFSNNGQCSNTCPDQTFPYQQQTCAECSPQCETCFDIYDNSCLSCRDTSLVLDSGTCHSSCSRGDYAYQAQFCVNGEQCKNVPGCRLCSDSGFCYDCLPDYSGEPVCKYTQILPKNFFIFFIIPLLLLVPILSIIFCVKVGRETYSKLLIYLLSSIELFSWVFTIPKLPQQAFAMVLCAFLLLRVLISIISYETYYNKQIYKTKQQRLLSGNQRESEDKTEQADKKSNDNNVKNNEQSNSNQQKITHKERLARFSAHFISCDAYELLMCKLGKPYINITHFTPYFVITILIRVTVMAFLTFILANYGSSGDLLYLPLIAIVSAFIILLTRLITSDKTAACLSKIRGG